MILCKLLEQGEMSVMALTVKVRMSQSALSQHLAKDAGGETSSGPGGTRSRSSIM